MKSGPTASPVARPVSDRFRLRWDVFQFVVLALSTMPHVTGVSWHEWLGVAIIPILVVHLLANWDWIVGTPRRFFRRQPGEVRFNQVWNALLFVVMTLVILSGILISERVVRFFGMTVKPDPFWHGLHDAGASLLLIMIGVHVAMHVRWALSTWRRPTPIASSPLRDDPS